MRDADFWIGWSGAGGPPWGARTSRGWSPGDWREPDCGAAPTASGLPAPLLHGPAGRDGGRHSRWKSRRRALGLARSAPGGRTARRRRPLSGPDHPSESPLDGLGSHVRGGVLGEGAEDVPHGRVAHRHVEFVELPVFGTPRLDRVGYHPLAPRAAGEDQAVDDAGGGEDGQDEEELYDHPSL